MSLGALDRPFFYLVLDNVKALFKIEKHKKVIEKLAICQNHVQPACFSMIVVNDALAKEIEVFGTQTNVFSVYMFSHFYFSPMSRAQIERVMQVMLHEMFLTDENAQHYLVDKAHLDTVYPDFFSLVY